MKESLLDEKQVEYKIDYKDEKGVRGPCIHIATAFFTLGILALLVTASMEMYQHKCSKNITIDCSSQICMEFTSFMADSIIDSDLELKDLLSKIKKASHKYRVNAVFIPSTSMIKLGKKFRAISEHLHKYGVALILSDVQLFGECEDESIEAENFTRHILNSISYVDGLVINPDLDGVCSGLDVAGTVKFIQNFMDEDLPEEKQKQKSRRIQLFIESPLGSTTSQESTMYHPNLSNEPIENTIIISRFKSPSLLPTNYEAEYDSTLSLAMIDAQLVQVQDSINDYRKYFNLLFLRSILSDAEYVLNDDPEFELASEYFKQMMKTYDKYHFNQFGISRKPENVVMHAADLKNHSVLTVCYPNKLNACNSFIQESSSKSAIFGGFNRQNITFGVELTDPARPTYTDFIQYHGIFHFTAMQLSAEASTNTTI